MLFGNLMRDNFLARMMFSKTMMCFVDGGVDGGGAVDNSVDTEANTPVDNTPPVTPETPPVTETPTSFRESIKNEELRNNKYFDRFEDKDSDTVAESMLNLSKLIDRKGVIRPVDGDPQHVIDKFQMDLGRPETVDGYEFDPIDMPDGLPANDILMDKLKEVAFKRGIDRDALNELHSVLVNGEIESYEGFISKAQEADQQAEQAHRQEWGADYDKNYNLGMRALSENSDTPEMKQRILDKYGKDPDVLTLLKNFGKKTGEDSITDDVTTNQIKSDAREERERIATDPRHRLNKAYYDGGDVNHQKALDEVQRLNKIIG